MTLVRLLAVLFFEGKILQGSGVPPQLDILHLLSLSDVL